MSAKSNSLVDHLFRHSYGKMVAIFVGKYGATKIENIEDAVQESYYKALSVWRIKGLPDDPEAWLYRVANNALVDILRKESRSLLANGKLQWNSHVKTSDPVLASEISDDQLKMIFICCHPLLTIRDQIALTLKLVSGFSIREISHSLLAKESLVKKSIYRSKKKIIEKAIQFKIPGGEHLFKRVEAVYSVLYLMFNEGYHSSKENELIRKDMCIEAMRLTKIMIDHPKVKSDPGKALMALMCYHSSRFNTRLDESNNIVLLEDQDRSSWDKDLIKMGNMFMKDAMNAKEFSIYHLEAAIAAEHSRAKAFNETNWSNLLRLYNMLCEYNYSDICQLNRVIILLQLNRLNEAEKILASMNKNEFKSKVYLYFAAVAELARKNQNKELERINLERALYHAPTNAEKRLLHKKIQKTRMM